MLAARRAPHQRAVARVELLHSFDGFDHLRSGQRKAALLRHDDPIAAASDDAHAAEAAVGAADQSDHRHAGGAHVQNRMNDLRNGDEAGIGFVQPHSTRVEQQQLWRRASSRGRAPAGRPVLAPCTSPTAPPMKAPSCAAISTGLFFQTAFADDDAVVESAGHVELGEVRARWPGRADPGTLGTSRGRARPSTRSRALAS